MKFDPALAAKLLTHTLNKLFSREAVVLALGMGSEAHDDEFWLAQSRTVTTRFHTYCLASLGLPLTLERDALTAEQFGLLTFVAQLSLRQGFTYSDLYLWWRNEGQYLHTAAYASKKREAVLASKCIHVMVFFESGPPKYLSDEASGYALVDSPEKAGEVAVLHEKDLERSSLDYNASQFVSVLKKYEAKLIKLVAASRRAPASA